MELSEVIKHKAYLFGESSDEEWFEKSEREQIQFDQKSTVIIIQRLCIIISISQ